MMSATCCFHGVASTSWPVFKSCKLLFSGVAGIDPMELLIGPLQKTLRAEQLPLRARGEGDVGRGRGVQPTEFDESRRERLLALFRAPTRHDEKTASRNRRSEPTPGLPPHEKTSLLAHPIPISWS